MGLTATVESLCWDPWLPRQRRRRRARKQTRRVAGTCLTAARSAALVVVVRVVRVVLEGFRAPLIAPAGRLLARFFRFRRHGGWAAP